MSLRMRRRGRMICCAAGLLASHRVFGQCAIETLAGPPSFNGLYDPNEEQPIGQLALLNGTLYGTTYIDGGCVFSVPVTGGTAAVLSNLNASTGCYPGSGLVAVGNTLYGTTSGGNNVPGTVFSISPGGGAPKVLASFGDFNGGPCDGLTVVGNTLYGATWPDADSQLGTTIYAFSLASGTTTVLSEFPLYGEMARQCPGPGLVVYGGKIFGTSNSGAYSNGNIFSVPVTGGQPTIIASFNTGSNSTGIDAGLTLVGTTLFGTTFDGGAYGDGTVFSVSVNGGPITVLASFNGSNGSDPQASLVAVGNTLYGTTMYGGANGDGEVFSIPVTGGPITVLASFTEYGCPQAGLIASGGTLYGVTPTIVYAVPLSSGAALTVAGGQVHHFPVTGSQNVSVTSINGLAIQSGGTAVVDPAANHAGRQLLVVAGTGLFFNGSAGGWSGLLDLTNNDMDVQAGSLSDVTSQIAQGVNNGNWTGTGGITSSAAAGDTSHLTALGVIQNNQGGSALYGNGSGQSLFDGTAPGTGDILVKYTYYGDANLDGVVDGSDYSLIDAGYASNQPGFPGAVLTGWYNGDFNYDGVIDGSDYALIDNAFNNQGVNLSTAAVEATDTAQVAGLPPTAVPEPLSMALICPLLVAPGRRRGVRLVVNPTSGG